MCVCLCLCVGVDTETSYAHVKVCIKPNNLQTEHFIILGPPSRYVVSVSECPVIYCCLSESPVTSCIGDELEIFVKSVHTTNLRAPSLSLSLSLSLSISLSLSLLSYLP